MKSKLSLIHTVPFIFIINCAFINVLWAHEETSHTNKSSHQHSELRGPHDGRLFQNGDISLELMLYEQAMPPHFRAYLYNKTKLVNLEKSRLIVQLKRFNGKEEQITFLTTDDFLQSNQVIPEPHSFDVIILLNYEGKRYSWHYTSYEGRVKISSTMLNAANIKIALAKNEILEQKLKVVGKITANRDTSAPIYPRYSGIIKTLSKNLGDEVIKGEVLVTVESNESLQNYNVIAPISGTVVQKFATAGELAKGDKPIYELANLANVWADLTLYRKEAPLVKQGMKVIVTGDEGKPQSTSTINYISPLGIEDSQTTLARTVLSNTGRIWLPGMYVNAAITINVKKVQVAVPPEAIQRLNDKNVVFVQQGDFFEATPVVLGEQDEQWVEIVSGLESGQRYVSKNSFFLKAELGKEGASHEH